MLFDLLKEKKFRIIVAFSLLVCVAAFFLIYYKELSNFSLSPYPDGKNFAFTVTDDPDNNSLERIRPVYDFLDEAGFKTTAAVWVFDAVRTNGYPDLPISDGRRLGDTCERPDYLIYMKNLQIKGFEIALHTVSAGNDVRERTIAGYKKFKELFRNYPKMNIMHSNNWENIYWGKKVVDNKILRFFFHLVFKFKATQKFSGEDTDTPFFWGDIAKDKTQYIRLWGTSNINTLKFNPSMPYHDPSKPFVNYWFSFSDGYLLKWFNKLISDKNIDQLIRERGASIVYTHFGWFSHRNKKTGLYELNSQFKEQMLKISKQKDGWFVPASTLLDRLLLMKKVKLVESKNFITIINKNNKFLHGLTILTKPETSLYDSNGKVFSANEEGEIVIPNMYAKEVLTLFSKPDIIEIDDSPSWLERINLVFQRILILLFSHKG